MRCASKWSNQRIGDCCTVGDGAHASIARHESGVLYLSSKNFKPHGLDLSKVDFISEADYQRHFKEKSKAITKPLPGDVLVGIIGSLGEPYVVRESDRFGLSSSVAMLRPHKNLLVPEYLYYWMRGTKFQSAVYGIKGGVAQSYLSLEMIRSLPVEFPSLSVQQRIVDILSAYDDLIENNARRIKILEQMARMLYREWFVNFRFPGHEKVTLVESEIGMIPEPFEFAELRSISQVLRGRSYKGDELSETNGIPFVNLKCIARDGGFRLDGMKRYTGAYKPTQVAKAGDVVMAVTDMTQERRIVARCGRVPLLPEGFATFSMDVVKIQPNQNVPREYLYSFLRFSTFADSVKEHANGANVLHLSPTLIEQFRLPVPPASLTKEFSSLVTPIYDLADTLERRNTNLRTTRDLLLPKLVSGEIEVPQAEQSAEAVTA